MSPVPALQQRERAVLEALLREDPGRPLLLRVEQGRLHCLTDGQGRVILPLWQGRPPHRAPEEACGVLSSRHLGQLARCILLRGCALLRLHLEEATLTVAPRELLGLCPLPGPEGEILSPPLMEAICLVNLLRHNSRSRLDALVLPRGRGRRRKTARIVDDSTGEVPEGTLRRPLSFSLLVTLPFPLPVHTRSLEGVIPHLDCLKKAMALCGLPPRRRKLPREQHLDQYALPEIPDLEDLPRISLLSHSGMELLLPPSQPAGREDSVPWASGADGPGPTPLPLPREGAWEPEGGQLQEGYPAGQQLLAPAPLPEAGEPGCPEDREHPQDGESRAGLEETPDPQAGGSLPSGEGRDIPAGGLCPPGPLPCLPLKGGPRRRKIRYGCCPPGLEHPVPFFMRFPPPSRQKTSPEGESSPRKSLGAPHPLCRRELPRRCPGRGLLPVSLALLLLLLPPLGREAERRAFRTALEDGSWQQVLYLYRQRLPEGQRPWARRQAENTLEQLLDRVAAEGADPGELEEALEGLAPLPGLEEQLRQTRSALEALEDSRQEFLAGWEEGDPGARLVHWARVLPRDALHWQMVQQVCRQRQSLWCPALQDRVAELALSSPDLALAMARAGLQFYPEEQALTTWVRRLEGREPWAPRQCPIEITGVDLEQGPEDTLSLFLRWRNRGGDTYRQVTFVVEFLDREGQPVPCLHRGKPVKLFRGTGGEGAPYGPGYAITSPRWGWSRLWKGSASRVERARVRAIRTCRTDGMTRDWTLVP